MFTLQTLLKLVENQNVSWKNPTEMTKAILQTLVDFSYPSDVVSKVYSGVNKGRNIRLDIVDTIDDDFSNYLQSVEMRLKSVNFRDGKFDSHQVVEKLHHLLEISTNLPQDIYYGLKQSYAKNKSNRPYLFIAECFYYSLEIAHNKTAEYINLEKFDNSTNLLGLEAWGGLLDDAILTDNLSPKFFEVVSKMTKKEIELFKKIAELAIYDEDGEYYLYAPVSNEEHQLYRDFGIDREDFLTLEEFGLINMGARIDNVVEVNDEPAGFQNDNLVFYFTTEARPFDIHYKSYSFTSVGQKLLDILEIWTSDDFFLKLTEIFKENHRLMPIDFFTVFVEEMEES